MSTPIGTPQNFQLHGITTDSCNGYKGFKVDYVTMNVNQTVCTLNSTRSFSAIESCCTAISGQFVSVDNSSILFCTFNGPNNSQGIPYYDCFNKIQLPIGDNITNITAYEANELGSCCSCGPHASSGATSSFVGMKAGMVLMVTFLGAMFSSV